MACSMGRSEGSCLSAGWPATTRPAEQTAAKKERTSRWNIGRSLESVRRAGDSRREADNENTVFQRSTQQKSSRPRRQIEGWRESPRKKIGKIARASGTFP